MSLELSLVDDGGTERWLAIDSLTGDYIETTPGLSLSLPLALTSNSAGDGTEPYDGLLAYQWLRALVDAAGPATAGTDVDGVAWFVDRARPSADVNSAVVAVTPTDIPEMDGVWAIVTGGEDSTTIPSSRAAVTLETTVLARYSEYGDRNDLATALEATGP